MKKILAFALLIILIPNIILYSDAMAADSLDIMWNPQDTSFARIGFSHGEITSIQLKDTEFKNVESVKLNATRRDGNNIIAYNDQQPLFAFFQIYGNTRFNVFLEIQPNENTDIPVSVSWTDMGTAYEITSGTNEQGQSINNRRRIFDYDTTKGADVDSIELTLEAVLPETATASSSYGGHLKLSLETM